MIAAVVLAAAAALPPISALPDELGFEMLVQGGQPSGFRIDATERVELFDGDPHRGHAAPEVRQVPGIFARATAQLAPYRALAGEPCVPTPADILVFRLSWRERGVLHAATFADSCRGIPVGLIESVRPIAALIELQGRERSAVTLEPPGR